MDRLIFILSSSYDRYPKMWVVGCYYIETLRLILFSGWDYSHSYIYIYIYINGLNWSSLTEPQFGQVVKAIVPLSSGVRGLGIDLQFPLSPLILPPGGHMGFTRLLSGPREGWKPSVSIKKKRFKKFGRASLDQIRVNGIDWT